MIEVHLNVIVVLTDRQISGLTVKRDHLETINLLLEELISL